MTWRSRIFLIRTVPLLYAASLAVSIILYWTTKDWHYFLIASPTVLSPAVFRLVPMDERRYNLKMAKINANRQTKIIEEKVRKLEKLLSQQQSTHLLAERVKKLEKSVNDQQAQ
jgi:hypothetical protein